jgi:antibiotic biosynthesis monooxygenase (ABM) superfamily enzyme
VQFLSGPAARRTRLAVTKLDDDDPSPRAMLRYLEQIDNTGEPREPGKLGCHISEGNLEDLRDDDLAWRERVPATDLHVGSLPKANRGGDLTATYAVAERSKELHRCGLRHGSYPDSGQHRAACATKRVRNMASERTADKGATVVITHRVRDDKLAEYEEWLKEIAPLARSSPGNLDWHVVRPIPGLTATFTVILRFDSEANLRAWMESPTRARLIEKAQPLFVTGDDFFISSGLDFWFTPAGAKAKVPVRWKQALVTWSAIYPLVLGVSIIVTPVLERFSLPRNRLLTTFLVTGTVVFLMVYVVMPRYTKLIRRWLFS